MRFPAPKPLRKMKLLKQKLLLPRLYEVPKTSVVLRDRLIKRSHEIATISDAKTESLAVATCRELRTHVKEVEEARKVLTAPLLEAQRRLKSLADAHIEACQQEIERNEKMQKLWDDSEKKRVEQESFNRQLEIERLDTERRSAEVKASQAISNGDMTKEMAESQRAKEMNDAWRALVTAPLPAVVRSKGASVKKYLRHDCYDVLALWRARPELCNPPEPKASAIQALCSAPEDATEQIPDMSVPGLKLYWDSRIENRSY